MADDTPSTSLWLLLRLGNLQRPDDEAWREFWRRYHEPILGWCRESGLSEADADDAAQGALVRLMKAMQTFVYDPQRSFRGFLRTTTQFAVGDLRRSRGRQPTAVSDSWLDARAAEAPGADSHLQAVEERLLADVAMRLAEDAADPEDWAAFRLRLNGVSRQDVARRMGKSVSWVTKACTRARVAVERMIRKLEAE